MATIAFDLSAAQAQRLAVAVGKRDSLVDAAGNRRSATLAEAKAHMMNYARTLTREVEAELDRETAPTRLPADITPT